MNIQTTQLNEMDFAQVIGNRLLEGENIARVEELSYAVHTATELTVAPFWATEIQDIVEHKCIEYTPKDIQEGNFLGLRIQAREDEVELTLGFVGQTEAEFEIVFKKELDADGFQVLGTILRYGAIAVPA